MTETIDRRLRFLTNILLISLFMLFFGFADYAIRFFYYGIQLPLPHPIIAGLVEPITSKFAPAIGLIEIYRRYDKPLDYLRRNAYKFALIAGVTVGVFERLLNVINREALIDVQFLLPAGIHIINGLLIIGYVLSNIGGSKGIRYWTQLISLILLGTVFHVMFNIWVMVN